MKNNEILEDKVYESENVDLELIEKVNQGVISLCYDFDLSRPMWLADNERDIKMVGKTSFYDHHFVDSITFDYFEVEIIEDKEY
jgi:hypothetical protein